MTDKDLMLLSYIVGVITAGFLVFLFSGCASFEYQNPFAESCTRDGGTFKESGTVYTCQYNKE